MQDVRPRLDQTLTERRSTKRLAGIVVILCLAVSLATVPAAWRFAPAPRAANAVQAVDYELTADCLSERQAWRSFNSTLAELERDLRFCIEVWPLAQASEP